MIRKHPLWMIVAIGALLAAACSSGGSGGSDGGSSDGGGAGDLVAISRESFASDTSFVESAAERTSAIESYQFEMTIGMDGVPEIGSMSFSADGAVDAANNRMRMAMDMSSLLGAAPAGTSEEELAMMREFLGDGSIEFILDGDTVYMKMALFALLMGADTEWISFSDPEVGQQLELGGLGLDQMGLSPGQLFELFGGIGEVEEQGRFVIRGVETTQFSGTIDVLAALDEVPAEERADLEAALAELDIAGFEAMPMSVWVDDDGYVRKVATTFDLGLAGRMSMAIELFNFGDAVTIDLPSSNEVTEITEDSLFGGAFGGGF